MCSRLLGMCRTYDWTVQIKQNGCDSVKVREVLMDMRRQRMGLIQTPDQLRFSYQAIIEGMKTDWDSINDVSTDNVLQHRHTRIETYLQKHLVFCL